MLRTGCSDRRTRLLLTVRTRQSGPMHRSARRPLAVAVAVVALLAIACGGEDGGGDDGDAATRARTVEITMRDIDFDPPAVEVRRGETVTFVFRNEGELVHDAYVGDAEAQRAHEEDMADESGGGGHDHGAGGDAVTVQPGATERLTHTFDDEGTLEIGCHQPGHYEAGMKVRITVVG